MRAYDRTVIATAILGVIASSAIAATPIVYPSKGQTPQQQQKDEGECAAWAKQTTGVDPVTLASTPPPAAAPPPAQAAAPQGQRARGAVRGAAAGAVIGEIANDDAGKGAATGAAVGVVAGGAKARRQKEAAAAQQQQAASQQKAAADQAEAKKQEALSTYNRANAACLEGRGYILK
jgi:hypothetical protein